MDWLHFGEYGYLYGNHQRGSDRNGQLCRSRQDHADGDGKPLRQQHNDNAGIDGHGLAERIALPDRIGYFEQRQLYIFRGHFEQRRRFDQHSGGIAGDGQRHVDGYIYTGLKQFLDVQHRDRNEHGDGGEDNADGDGKPLRQQHHDNAGLDGHGLVERIALPDWIGYFEQRQLYIFRCGVERWRRYDQHSGWFAGDGQRYIDRYLHPRFSQFFDV